MNETKSIAEAAQKVLRTIGRPAPIDEIYAEILRRQL